MGESLRARRRLRLPFLRLPLAAILAAQFFAASPSAAQPRPSTTSDQARQEAIDAIPLARVQEAFRQDVANVLNDPSLYRRLPTEVVDCHPGIFSFLSQNPEVLVEIWRELGVSNVSLIRSGPTSFDLTDGMGTTGQLDIVESNCNDEAQNRIIMYTKGKYEGKPFKRPVTASCVLLLRSGSVTETNGRRFVAAQLDTFVKLDRPSVELLAKAIHPWVGKTTDRNFTDTMTFVGNFSYTAERRPTTISRLTNKLEHVDQQRKEHFIGLAELCAKEGVTWRKTRLK